MGIHLNKKVLLRERKRHTARRVASTPSAVLSREGGTPSLAGEYPILGSGWGYPMPSQGVPHPWVPPVWDWGTPWKEPGTSHWGPPWKGHGTSESIMGWRWGTPLGVNRQMPVKTVPSLRTTYAGGNNGIVFKTRKYIINTKGRENESTTRPPLGCHFKGRSNSLTSQKYGVMSH